MAGEVFEKADESLLVSAQNNTNRPHDPVYDLRQHLFDRHPDEMLNPGRFRVKSLLFRHFVFLGSKHGRLRKDFIRDEPYLGLCLSCLQSCRLRRGFFYREEFYFGLRLSRLQRCRLGRGFFYRG